MKHQKHAYGQYGVTDLFTITVCYHRNPSCEAALKWALWGVLTVLKVLHSHGYVHQDIIIRWANVMKSGNNWLLLDYEHSEKTQDSTAWLAS